MLSILLEVQKDETFLKQMFDISAITPLVKWCSDSKKNSIGHFLPSKTEGIISNKIDGILGCLGGRDHLLKIKKIIIIQFYCKPVLLRNAMSKLLS